MTWSVCDKCGKDVTTSDGVIDIDKLEVDRAESEWRAWELAHPGVVSWDEILDSPAGAKWQWGHRDCVTGDMYEIPAGRFDTLGKTLDWTLHMTEKAWLSNTDWNELVRRLHDVPSA